jgi:hypothetical protein
MQLKFIEDMPKVHHRYRLHFCHNPLPYFKKLDELEGKIRQVLENPTLIVEEDDKKIQDIRNDIRVQENRFQDEHEVCEDINVDVSVNEVKYKDGTVIVLSMPNSLANTLNHKRFNIGSYQVRLENL